MITCATRGVVKPSRGYICFSCQFKEAYPHSWTEPRRLYSLRSPVVYPSPDPSVAAALYAQYNDDHGAIIKKVQVKSKHGAKVNKREERTKVVALSTSVPKGKPKGKDTEPELLAKGEDAALVKKESASSTETSSKKLNRPRRRRKTKSKEDPKRKPKVSIGVEPPKEKASKLQEGKVSLLSAPNIISQKLEVLASKQGSTKNDERTQIPSHDRENQSSRQEAQDNVRPKVKRTLSKSKLVTKDQIIRGNAKEKRGSGSSVAKSPSMLVKKYAPTNPGGLDVKKKAETKSPSFSAVPGLQTLADALRPRNKSAFIRAAQPKKSEIQVIDAHQLDIAAIQVDQPPVPGLTYGLDRVLFNPGVYHLQDPRSRVFNFDPYLQNIMPVSEFDFNALKEYITSSRDRSLQNIARIHGKRYVGSSSSMTGVLAHFHFLLSQWREIDTRTLSRGFPDKPKSFTNLQRCPSAIFLKWKDGTYAIDADKEFDSANILLMLGKSMEKLLTLNTEDYERYRKSSSDQISDEERNAPESFHYSGMGDFLMRSQLDAFDPRLPGTGMFDLKTRAVVSIRMDARNHEQGSGYEIKTRFGEWESFEREYFDMIRAAFLKYSLQVRMGRMDGIFVAFHNTQRIFGFRYISLPEMDSTLHGQWDTSIGDQEFKLSLDLMNKILDRAIQKFPEQSLRIHFETREPKPPFMYVFAEPVTEEQVQELQSRNDAKREEFERDILGIARGGPVANDNEASDNRWAEIHAKVQEAMEKDERSLDDINELDDVIDRASSGIKNVDADPREGNENELVDDDLLQGEERIGQDDEDMNAAALEDGGTGLGNSEGEGEDGSENENDKNGGDVEVSVMDVEQKHDGNSVNDVGNSVDEDISDSKKSGDNRLTDSEVDEPKELGLHDGEGSKALCDTSKDLRTTETADPSSEGTFDHLSESDKSMVFTPGINESKPAEFVTNADTEFINEIDQEHASTVPLNSSGILAMTLTIRNKVNDRYVPRPLELKRTDKWSVEYALAEVPTEDRAWALYRACQLRRKRMLEHSESDGEDTAANYYIERLRGLSQKGKVWRKEQEETEEGKPKFVVGKSSPS